MNRDRKSRFDLLVAALALITGVSVTAWAYAGMLRIEKPKEALVESLHRGSTVYYARHRGNCVGRFEGVLSEMDRDFKITFKGSVRMIYADRPIEGTINSAVYFNPLGQLQQGVIKLQSGHDRLVIEARAVNPITLTIRSVLGGQAFKTVRKVPGPVLLRQDGDDAFHIEYRSFNKSSIEFAGLAARNLTSQLGLTLENGGVSGECKGGAISALDLQPLVDMAERFFPEGLE